MTIFIDAEVFVGLEGFFRSAPDRSARAASRAINQIATRSGAKRIKDAIYGDIAFPKGYLDSTDRLGLTKFATPGDLEAIMTARQRATSLARFLTPGQSLATSKIGGVTVKVSANKPSYNFKEGFLIRLNSGTSNTETVHNLGLAVRLKNGESLRGGKGFQMSSNGKTTLWLMYSVSVDQIFRRVAEQQSPAIGEDVAAEFMRQFTLLSNEG